MDEAALPPGSTERLSPTGDQQGLRENVNSVHDARHYEVSDRKRRLLACACFRSVWNELDDACRRAVEVGELYADGLADANARTVAWLAVRASREQLIAQQDFERALRMTDVTRVVDVTVPPVRANWFGARFPTSIKRRVRKALISHILPDQPFRRDRHEGWPAFVVQLAESLYAGTDCRLPLHDALLEAGHPELAEHFGAEEWHPKGCWALDVILGRS
jgi:hypothetical protein